MMALERSRTFADLLREYRRAAQMTQEKLAERAGLSVRALRKLESGTSLAPRRDTIDLLAAALQLAPEKRTLLEASASRQQFLPVATPTAPLLGTVGLQPVDPLSVALVGRSSELALLEKHLAGKGPPLLVLAGEPGIGKTRLLREASSWGRTQGWSVLEGGCHRRSGQEPYIPLLTALASSLRSQPPAQVRRMLEGCAWLVRLLPELAESSLVPVPEWQLPPAQERRLMFAAVGRYLANLAGPSGTLLVLDDLQWAGQDALDLLADLLRTLNDRTGRHLRVIAAYRSTEVLPKDPLGILLADLAREGLATPVDLGRLTPEAADELASMLFVEVPSGEWDELQKRMVERTGGVPYFLVSWAQALQNQVNAQVPEAASGGQGGSQLPWTVTQSIRQRLALLPEAAQDLINILAICGREAAIPVLTAVATRSGLEHAEMLEALELAGQAGLLVEAEGGESYAFAHDLIREVALADLGAARRTTLHRWVGETILQVTPPGRELRAAELAWHFARGGEPERALPYALQAGEQAEAVYAHAEAERHFQVARELALDLGDREREADVLEKLAEVLWGVGHMREMLHVLEAAADLYRATGNPDKYAWVVAHMQGPYNMMRQPEVALKRLQSALTFLTTRIEVTQGAASAGEAHELPLQPKRIPEGVLLAESTEYPPPFDSGAELTEQAVSLLSARTAGHVYYTLAICLYDLNRYKDAVPLAQSASRYAQAAGDRRLLVRALNVLACAWGYVDYGNNVLATLETALPVAEEAKDFEGLSMVEVNRAECLMVRGKFADAEQSIQRGLEAAEQYGMPDRVAYALSILATMSVANGAWDQALDFCQRSTEAARILDVASPTQAEWVGLVQGRIFLARGEVHPALEHLQAALQMTEGLLATLIQVQAHATLAEVDLVHSAPAAALARLAPLLDRTTAYERVLPTLSPCWPGPIWSWATKTRLPPCYPSASQWHGNTSTTCCSLMLSAFRRCCSSSKVAGRKRKQPLRRLLHLLARCRTPTLRRRPDMSTGICMVHTVTWSGLANSMTPHLLSSAAWASGSTPNKSSRRWPGRVVPSGA